MSNNLTVDLSRYVQPDYVGSVQELFFSKEQPGCMVCKTTSGGSVFDVGTIFSIPNSDISRTGVRHKIYSLLGSKEEWAEIDREIPAMFEGNDQFINFLREGILKNFISNGAKTHHIGMIDRETGEVFKNGLPAVPSPYVLVKKYEIIKPARIKCQASNLWDYSRYYAADKYVVPLENIVRFGVVPGSSIYKKYTGLSGESKTLYLEELGLTEKLVPFSPFSVPIVDFTTKYEPEDRSISLQEALYLSGCEGRVIADIIRMSMLGAILVQRFFNRIGLFLWDLKWEIAKDGEELVFVDTIDTDSIRVTLKVNHKNKDCFVNINKQSMRDYYKIIHPEWFEAVRLSKQTALKSGKPFHEHLQEGQENGIYPKTPEVDESFIKIQEDKFNALLSYIYGNSSADRTVEKFKSIAQAEILFYEAKNVLDRYLDLNGL